MLNVSEQWKNQIYNRPVILVKAEVDLLTGEKLYLDYEDSDDDFMAAGITLQDSTTSESSFNLGTAVMNVFSFSLNNMDGRYSNTIFSGATITPYFGFKLGSGEVEWVKKGVFNISSNNNKLPKIDFQAYDNMSKLDLPFSAVKITYPITLGNMAKAICDYCGVGLETTAFDNSSYSIKTAPIGTDYSCRKMISCIAQISGGFARFNAEGKLEIKWYSDDIDHEIPVYKDVRAEAKDVTITGIQVSSYYNEDALSEDKPKNTETSLTGVDGFVIAITENPLIPYGSAKTVSTYLGNKLNGTKFRPIELNTFYDPSLEAGDKVKIKDVRNNEYIFFVTNLTANIGGVAHISCVAETVRENTANQYSNSSSAIVKVLDVVNAKIQNLVTSHLDAEIAKVGYLKAEKADIDYLKVGEVDAVKAEIEDAIIKNLDAEFATIENLNATKATIENLQATVAVIDKAYVDEARVNTLIADKGFVTSLQVGDIVANEGFITKLETNNLLSKYATLEQVKIENGFVTNITIGKGAVGTAQIADGSITDAKIANLTANKITAGTLSVERLEIRGSDKSIVYALNNITGALQAQNVDTLNGEILTERTITADKIVANAITANEIAAKAITANHILAGAITTEKIDTNAVTADKIDLVSLFAQDIVISNQLKFVSQVTNETIGGSNAVFKFAGNSFELNVGWNQINLDDDGIELTSDKWESVQLEAGPAMKRTTTNKIGTDNGKAFIGSYNIYYNNPINPSEVGTEIIVEPTKVSMSIDPIMNYDTGSFTPGASLTMENGVANFEVEQFCVNNEYVDVRKVLYNNSTGTYGTVTLSESAENFSMIEIIVGFSDIYGCQSIKVYSPNGKVTDISATIPTATAVTSIRTRCTISGTTITQSNNARAMVYVDAVTVGTGITNTNNTNKMFIKTVIGYR